MKTLAKIFVLTLILMGCASMSPHQKIVTACESAASSMQAITAAKQAGRITAPQYRSALSAYRLTTPVCEPPAQSLDAVRQAALDAAVAELVARAGGVK